MAATGAASSRRRQEWTAAAVCQAVKMPAGAATGAAAGDGVASGVVSKTPHPKTQKIVVT